VKVEASSAQIESLRRYAEPFDRVSPPLFALFPSPIPDRGGSLFPFEADSDRGLGALLLASALYRPGGEAVAAHVIAALFRKFGNDIFKLNRIPFDAVRETVDAALEAWSAEASAGTVHGVRLDDAERARIPGILRSVCDFFYRVGPLGAWLDAAPDWETRTGELCNEIYWMGLRSRTRAKARMFFWSITQLPDFAARHPEWMRHAAAFQWPVTDGHMRYWIDILKPGRTAGARSPEERQTAFAALGQKAFPDAPWRLFLPLESFLRSGGAASYACRAVQGGCRPCPLASDCPAAGHFIPGEGS
jgi:hypothetical protein